MRCGDSPRSAVGFAGGPGGLRELPGRKAVVFLSDGLSLAMRGRTRFQLLDLFRRLVDQANRASVLVYAMDARGLGPPGFGPADQMGVEAVARLERALAKQRLDFMDSLEGMIYLARQTGGFAVYNSNDFDRGVKRILDDLAGYYLLGYKPHSSTFVNGKEGPEYHKIVMKVNKPGMRAPAFSAPSTKKPMYFPGACRKHVEPR